MSGRPVFTAEQRAAAISRVEKGEKRADVALDLKVSPSTMSRWCTDAGLPQLGHGGAYFRPGALEKRAEARKLVEAGTPRAVAAERVGASRQAVLEWTADLPAPKPRPHARNGLEDDGIVDEVAVERALHFDPADIAALRPSEHRAFTEGVKRLLRSRWFESSSRYEAWLALPEASRITYAVDSVRRARIVRVRTEAAAA